MEVTRGVRNVGCEANENDCDDWSIPAGCRQQDWRTLIDGVLSGDWNFQREVKKSLSKKYPCNMPNDGFAWWPRVSNGRGRKALYKALWNKWRRQLGVRDNQARAVQFFILQGRVKDPNGKLNRGAPWGVRTKIRQRNEAQALGAMQILVCNDTEVRSKVALSPDYDSPDAGPSKGSFCNAATAFENVDSVVRAKIAEMRFQIMNTIIEKPVSMRQWNIHGVSYVLGNTCCATGPGCHTTITNRRQRPCPKWAKKCSIHKPCECPTGGTRVLDAEECVVAQRALVSSGVITPHKHDPLLHCTEDRSSYALCAKQRGLNRYKGTGERTAGWNFPKGCFLRMKEKYPKLSFNSNPVAQVVGTCATGSEPGCSRPVCKVQRGDA